MTRTFALTRSFVVIAAVLAMMTITVVSLGVRGTSLFAATANPELEIAPLTSGSWTKAAEGTWTVSGLQPGRQESSGVRLRILNPRGDETIVLSVAPQDQPGPLLAQTRIASMTMDSVELLPLWSHCGGGELTLIDLMTCPNPPDLPAPSPAGSAFIMSFTLSEDASNEAQGQSTGVLAFTFSLYTDGVGSAAHESERPMDESSTSAPPEGGSPATGSTPPPGSAPAERPVDELDGAASPPPGAAPGAGSGPGSGPGAPPPGNTGHGMLAAATELVTVPAVSLAAVLAATMLVLVLAHRRRKRDEAA